MKFHKHIFPLIATILIAVFIISTGYHFLAKTGNRLSLSVNSITPIQSANNASYVFYQQADTDIVLFPWNYSENAISFTEYYGDTISAKDLIDTINLYDYLRYYFYRIIPGSQKAYIFDNDLSLSILMDYDNLEKYLTIYEDYYYFSRIIDIQNISYYLNVSFNSTGYIYAFQCREIRSDMEYSNDAMNNGNSDLTEFLNDDSNNYVNILLSDMCYLEGILSNYVLNTSNESDSRLNFTEDIYHEKFVQKQIDESSASTKNIDNYTKFTTYSSNGTILDTETDKDITTISYQIVKTQYEYLIVILEADVIIHYDPISHTFNGFNIKVT